ncbi:DUF6457 domain-containing protein [Cellulosimicrobium sp. CUA-896]|uniref:DUF6457 domain-containing protein n=1 Tax=Cellulosimicrobium sp. CUA-896 TaxID=1517881 RepID=UPI000966B531|nr:DUF6457 domain-containing protein [Cellulosimicrobium sp. CUA-896]OLT54672.1 hypothetical protein BJF88_08220 [Cellulosimicrobium sp. CUA-896]
MTNLERWVDALAAEFDLDPDVVDIAGVLDLARDAAHHVERPAAPLTAFVAGYVAGRAAGGSTDLAVDDVLDRASTLALAWAPEPELPGTGTEA